MPDEVDESFGCGFLLLGVLLLLLVAVGVAASNEKPDAACGAPEPATYVAAVDLVTNPQLYINRWVSTDAYMYSTVVGGSSYDTSTLTKIYAQASDSGRSIVWEGCPPDYQKFPDTTKTALIGIIRPPDVNTGRSSYTFVAKPRP